MNKLSKLEPVIHEILKSNPITRTDDHFLYIAYWAKVKPEVSFIDFCKNYKKHRASNMASVERCRRKLQSVYPELKNKEVAELRFEETTQYIQYALDK